MNSAYTLLMRSSARAKYHIPKNLAPKVNLSYCMDLWTLGSKVVGHLFNDVQGHFKVIQLLTLCPPSGFFQLWFWSCSDILLFIRVALNLDTFTCNLKTEKCNLIF